LASISASRWGGTPPAKRARVNAPKTVAVHREEIYQRIKGETETGSAPDESAEH
jgi:sRNA-binding carbon storage regulator CsrA